MPPKSASRKRGAKKQRTTTGAPRATHTAVRRALLKWYRANGRTHPWRGTGDPYAVWLSEIMLQQTQIATVTPYFERFMAGFPTVRTLAAAPLEKVLELWSGLGYYRRARHLHQAAQTVASLPDAEFPQNYEGLRALPGIGDYTARAILSIAFNRPYAVLDGNVARVVARLYSLRGNIHQPDFRRRVEDELSRLLARDAAGDFNQAMMELGQVICLPRTPLCSTCPISGWCSGSKSGNPEEFPLKRPRRAAELHHLAVAWTRQGAKVAMVRGLAEGLMDDLLNFPSAFGATPEEALAALREKLARLTNAGIEFGEPLAEIRHAITYRSIQGRVYPVRLVRPPRSKSIHWVQLEKVPHAAISQLARKITDKMAPARILPANNPKRK